MRIYRYHPTDTRRSFGAETLVVVETDAGLENQAIGV